MDDIKSLVNEKGQDLTYDDFKHYLHFDSGSGLLIYNFPINNTYSLNISNFNDDIKLDYIKLYNSNHEAIDIRVDDINDFLK